MTRLQEMMQKLKDAKPELETKYFVVEIGLFGSHVRNEATPDSDLDILIDYRRGLTLFKLAQLRQYLEQLLNVKVDIALKRSLKKRIGKQVLSEVIYI